MSKGKDNKDNLERWWSAAVALSRPGDEGAGVALADELVREYERRAEALAAAQASAIDDARARRVQALRAELNRLDWVFCSSGELTRRLDSGGPDDPTDRVNLVTRQIVPYRGETLCFVAKWPKELGRRPSLWVDSESAARGARERDEASRISRDAEEATVARHASAVREQLNATLWMLDEGDKRWWKRSFAVPDQRQGARWGSLYVDRVKVDVGKAEAHFHGIEGQGVAIRLWPEGYGSPPPNWPADWTVPADVE